MGYERDTYYFDRLGRMTSNPSSDSVLEVRSVEHDVYGNPSFSASVIDLPGAKEALPVLRRQRPYKECSAIEEAIRQKEPGEAT